MMEKFSVKIKITVWITVLTIVLSGLLSVFMLSVSNTVFLQTVENRLSQTMINSLEKISISDGHLNIRDGFAFYDSGVSLLIYNKNGALLAGQIPVAFTIEETFENGVIRAVNANINEYLILDIWVPDGWDNGVWVRGLIESPDYAQTSDNLQFMLFTALPGFILFAAIGTYLIIKKSFSPLNKIMSTASAINEARDLSGRIGLPEGNDEFSRLAASFDSMFERLERSFEAEKQFTDDASHELRTPVAIIKGACEYAEKYDETPEERGETIAMIHRQAVRMSDLIYQLLSIARLDQGTEMTHFEQTDLGELAVFVCGEQNYDQARLSVISEENVIAQADPSLISRLIRNLLDNAFKYGGKDCCVDVSVKKAGNECQISVKDDGAGIPYEEQEKIWQRFYQVDASRGDDSGSGLGLAIVRQIAEMHGGYMTLESIPGIGSDFILHIPAEKI